MTTTTALRHLLAASLLALLVVACKHRLDIRFKSMLANQCILSRLPLICSEASGIALSDASNDIPPRPRIPQQAPLMAAAAVGADAGVAEDAASKADAVVEAAGLAADLAAVGAMALDVWATAWSPTNLLLHISPVAYLPCSIPPAPHPSCSSSRLPLIWPGAVVARLNGTEITSAAGDVNATGVISLAVFQSGSDYNIRYGASIRLTAPGAPLSIAISTGAAGSADSGAALLEFSATEAAWANITWNGTRRDSRGRRHTAPVPKYFGFFRPAARTGYVYGFSGVWYNATQYSNSDGQSYFEVANLLLANPGGYFGIVKTEAFADGAARGQFANFTRPTPDTFWQRS
ncbi:unnamed protein product [Closterium sp. NIES-54]